MRAFLLALSSLLLLGEDPAEGLGIRSIVVLPPLNRTVDVLAPDHCLPLLTRPLVERGYYVFPVWTVKQILDEEGLSDAGLLHGADPRRIGALFGADAVLLPTLHHWEAKYAVLGTFTVVDVEFRLLSATTGAELWKRRQRISRTTDVPHGGHPGAMLVAMLVGAALQKAAPDLTGPAREAVRACLHTALPEGPRRLSRTPKEVAQ